LPRLAWTVILLFMPPAVVGWQAHSTMPSYWLSRGSHKLFSWSGLEPQSFWSQPTK
jgi:hypothetical protein